MLFVVIEDIFFQNGEMTNKILMRPAFTNIISREVVESEIIAAQLKLTHWLFKFSRLDHSKQRQSYLKKILLKTRGKAIRLWFNIHTSHSFYPCLKELSLLIFSTILKMLTFLSVCKPNLTSPTINFSCGVEIIQIFITVDYAFSLTVSTYDDSRKM